MVTVDELARVVNIALGTLPVRSACLAMDTDADGRVTVDEIIRAVRSALGLRQ